MRRTTCWLRAARCASSSMMNGSRRRSMRESCSSSPRSRSSTEARCEAVREISRSAETVCSRRRSAARRVCCAASAVRARASEAVITPRSASFAASAAPATRSAVSSICAVSSVMRASSSAKRIESEAACSRTSLSPRPASSMRWAACFSVPSASMRRCSSARCASCAVWRMPSTSLRRSSRSAMAPDNS